MGGQLQQRLWVDYICWSAYGRKSVDRIYNLYRLIVVDCDYAESCGWFLSGGNADASHAVYIVKDDS